MTFFKVSKLSIVNCQLSIVLLISLFLISCHNNPVEEKVQLIELKIETERFDTALFEIKPENTLAALPALGAKYGKFFDIYCRNVIRISSPDSNIFANNLKQFITDPDMRSAYEDSRKLYPDLNFLNVQLSEAFKHYKYYFPDSIIPKVIANISGFNYAVITTDSVLAVGLEMYLGEHSRFYEMLGLPQYKLNNMRREYMAVDCIKGWAGSSFEEPMLKDDLLSDMIVQGRILYFTDAMLPDMPDSLKTGFKQKQLEWCRDNEANCWAFIIEKKLLYSNDPGTATKIMKEGPFTQGMSHDSPGRLGEWLGWQLVKAYMKNNPSVDLKALMVEKDAQKVLTLSKYKPRK